MGRMRSRRYLVQRRERARMRRKAVAWRQVTTRQELLQPSLRELFSIGVLYLGRTE